MKYKDFCRIIFTKKHKGEKFNSIVLEKKDFDELKKDLSFHKNVMRDNNMIINGIIVKTNH